MAFLVRDFIHAAPSNGHCKVKKLRQGAATAFVDAETGDLIAGYSYNTCLYAVAAHPDFPAHGRLYVNLTNYGITSRRHASWIRSHVNAVFLDRYLPTGEVYDWGGDVTVRAAPLNGDPADALNVPRGASNLDLIALCEGGERGPDGDWHASTTFAPPDGQLSCAYFIANTHWLDRDASMLHAGYLGNAQRREHVAQYIAWLGEDPCGCQACDREFGPADIGNNAA